MNTPKTTPLGSFLPALSPLSFVRMVWKRKWIVLTIWTVVTAATIVTVQRLPTIYSSEALVLVDSQKIPEKFVSSTVSTDLQDRIATISQQILSSSRIKKIIEDYDLYSATRKTKFEEEILEQMRADITIKVDRGWTGNRPGAFRVGYQGPNAAVVAQVANRLANLFIEENLKTREVQAEGTSEFIQTQLDEAKKKLDQLEAALSAYKLQHNGELPQQENLLAGTLSRLQVELESNRDAMNRAQQAKVSYENALSGLESTIAIMSRPAEPAQSGAPVLPVAGSAVNAPEVPKASEALEARLEQMLGRYGEDHPEVRRLRAEIQSLKSTEQHAAEAKTTPPAAKPGQRPAGAPPSRPANATALQAADLRLLNERMSTAKAQIEVANKDLEFRKTEETRILKDISMYQARVNRLPLREQEMAQVTRDYEISKQNYRSLLDKKLAAEMSTDMEHRQKSERFTVLDQARVPEKPSKPNRPLFNTVGTVAGLALALLCGLAVELRRNVLLGEWELPANTVVLGRLPEIRIAALMSSEGDAGRRPRRRSRWKLRGALISSALLSLLVVIGAAVYFLMHRL